MGRSGWCDFGGTFLGLKSGLKQMKKINTLLKHYINFLQIVNLSQWFDHSTDVERLQLFCYDGIQIISLFFWCCYWCYWLNWFLIVDLWFVDFFVDFFELMNFVELRYFWVSIWLGLKYFRTIEQIYCCDSWMFDMSIPFIFLFIFKLKVEQKTHKCANV